jgi:hypothetical protein
MRAALVAGVAVAALGFAGSALAAYTTPKIAASVSGSGMRIGAVVANTDDPTARVAIYVPNGYTITSATAGTKLGSVTATAAAADLGGAILPLTGDLLAVDPNTLTAAQKQGIAICLNGQTAAQTWVLHLTAAGQTLDVPMLVVPAVGPEAAVGYQAKLLVCLPPPDVPSGTPGRAQFGAKLLSATFTVSAIAAPIATGDSRWTSVFTPYNPGVGTVNAAGTVETQSIVHVPTKLTLTYKKARVVTFKRVKGKRVKSVSTRVTYSTAVTEAGNAATGTVTATAGGKKVGGAKGAFTFKGASVTLTATADLHKGTAVPTGAAQSNADLFYTDLGASSCTKTPIFSGVPCLAATVARATPKASVRITGFRK